MPKASKVIIDEAWYGFARFHPAFRPTAMEAGADYATQSTHKVLSAFSQSSMIHVNDPDFNEHLFRENFNMHTSTSPQYSMIASLDVARKQAMMEGTSCFRARWLWRRKCAQQINSTGVFRVLDLPDLLPDEVKSDNIQLDSTKVTVDISRCGFTVEDLTANCSSAITSRWRNPRSIRLPCFSPSAPPAARFHASMMR